MIDNQKRFFSKSVAPEQIICEYWRKYVQNHDPEEIIAEFQGLFAEGRCSSRFVKSPLDKILESDDAQAKYFYSCSQSFCIIIYHWLKQKQDRQFIFKLLTLLESQKSNSRHYNRHKKKIISLFQEFLQSKYPANFARIAIACNCPTKTKVDSNLEFKFLLCRYPYLYKHILLFRDDYPELVNLVNQLQDSRDRKFELKMAQHFIYRSRLVEIAKAKQLSSGAGKLLRKVSNPTLLSHRDLQLVVKQYIKKIDNSGTLADLSRKFVLTNNGQTNYQQFKLNLIKYLAYGVVPRKPEYSLSSQLADILTDLYYQSDKLTLNDSLTLLTCRKLYQKIMNMDSKSKDHKNLIELVANLGTAQTVMLLVKIALICPAAKVDLEARLANLFVNYESRIVEKNLWLVKLMEHFRVTLSIYFGDMDIPVSTII